MGVAKAPNGLTFKVILFRGLVTNGQASEKLTVTKIFFLDCVLYFVWMVWILRF